MLMRFTRSVTKSVSVSARGRVDLEFDDGSTVLPAGGMYVPTRVDENAQSSSERFSTSSRFATSPAAGCGIEEAAAREGLVMVDGDSSMSIVSSSSEGTTIVT